MVELDRQGELTRDEVATFLRDFADELAVDASSGGSQGREQAGEPAPVIDGDDDSAGRRMDDRGDDHHTGEARGDVDTTTGSEPDRITFVVGGDSATVTVPHTIDFEVEVESRSPMMSGSLSQEVGLDLSWEIEDPEERELRGDEIEVS